MTLPSTRPPYPVAPAAAASDPLASEPAFDDPAYVLPEVPRWTIRGAAPDAAQATGPTLDSGSPGGDSPDPTGPAAAPWVPPRVMRPGRAVAEIDPAVAAAVAGIRAASGEPPTAPRADVPRQAPAARPSTASAVLAPSPPRPPLTPGALRAVVLTVAEMYRADGAAAAAGIATGILMEAAGAAVVGEIRRRFPPCPTVVLCGPGNNGGDGAVVARMLQEAGWPVRLALHGAVEQVKGDAAESLARWPGPVLAVEPAVLDGMRLVVDALFGAGLARPIDGQARAVVEVLAQRPVPVVAIDIPSGVHGDSGAILGVAPQAALTVTFFRPKAGHLLHPGRALCGELVVADIGIPASVLPGIEPSLFCNQPSLWQDRLRIPEAHEHKYDRGHAVIVAGAAMPGAALLATRAARRSGIGLVTVVAAAETMILVHLREPGALTAPLDGGEGFAGLLRHKRRSAVLIGPGAGVTVPTGERVLAALQSGLPVVLDADALAVFAGDPQVLFRAIRRAGPVLLTPHEGEFARLFPATGDRIARTRAAARSSGAVVLLKGADTVVAHPDGRAAVNIGAPADLATAGSGDVLAGIAVGLMAQAVPAFEAACAAAWLHGEAAVQVGAGLIAEDLPEALLPVLRRLRTERCRDVA